MELWLSGEHNGPFNVGGIARPDVVLTDHILDALAVISTGFMSLAVAHE